MNDFLFLLPIILIGTLLSVWGGLVIFSDKGLDWMYKNGIWTKEDPNFSEKGGRKFDRYIRGTRILAIGLIVLLGSISLLIYDLFK